LIHEHYNSRGINIDPNVETIKKFKQARPNDINLEFAINDTVKNLIYTKYNHSAVNTLSSKMVDIYDGSTNSPFVKIETVDVETVTLASILDTYLPQNQSIDLLDIDAEGLDLNVLKSNNWDKYRPTIILVETHGMSLKSAGDNETYQFLSSKGYQIMAHMYVTSLFVMRSIES